MSYIKGFGFQIYRLREAKPENEFLLYDIKNNSYNQYSQKRVLEILKQELKQKKIDYEKFIIEKIWKLENPDEDPEKKVRVSKKKINIIFQEWIDKDLELIDNIGFRPIKDKVYMFNEKIYFNTFIIPEAMDNENYKIKEGYTFDEFKKNAPNIYTLFSNLHNHSDNAIKDTLYKLADKLQYPFEKSQDCIIFYPAEAAGKGIFYKHIIQPIFNNYCKKILMKMLKSDFNGYLPENLILVLEEGKRDLELIETLKEVVTEGTMLINPKNEKQREEIVYFLTFVFSNNMNPIDLGKRRGSYHLCKPLGKNIEESQLIGAKLCENIPNEIDNLLFYLHNLEVDHQKALMPFNTLAKEQVNDLNKNTLELFYDYLLTFENLESAIKDSYKKRFSNDFIMDLGILPKDDKIYISKDIIKDTYNNFCIIEGFKSNLIKHNKDIVQLWALMEIPVISHKRILLTSGKNEGRKLDHLELIDINRHLKERFSKND